MPKVTQQIQDLNLGSWLPRLCTQPLSHHCFSLHLDRKRCHVAINDFKYNRKKREKYREKEGMQSPRIPLTYFSGDFSLCLYIHADTKKDEHECASKDMVGELCPKDKKKKTKTKKSPRTPLLYPFKNYTEPGEKNSRMISCLPIKWDNRSYMTC